MTRRPWFTDIMSGFPFAKQVRTSFCFLIHLTFILLLAKKWSLKWQPPHTARSHPSFSCSTLLEILLLASSTQSWTHDGLTFTIRVRLDPHCCHPNPTMAMNPWINFDSLTCSWSLHLIVRLVIKVLSELVWSACVRTSLQQSKSNF